MQVGIQAFLIRWILKPFLPIANKFSIQIRHWLFTVSLFILILLQISRDSGLLTGRYLLVYIPACFCFGIMILVGILPEIRPVKFSPLLIILWYGVAISLLISGILVDSNYLADAMLWLVVFPILFVVFGNWKFEEFVPWIFQAVYLSFVVCLLINIFFFPLSDIKYKGFFLNQNTAAIYCVAVFACAFSDILSTKKFTRRTFILEIILGFAVAFIFYTNSRGGQLAVTICLIFSYILKLIVSKYELKRIVFHQVLPTAIAILIITPMSLYIFRGGYALASLAQQMVQKTDTSIGMTSSEVGSSEAGSSEAGSSEAGSSEAGSSEAGSSEVGSSEAGSSEAGSSEAGSSIQHPVEQQPEATLGEIIAYNEQKFEGGGRDFNRYTAGRVELWFTYGREIGLLGNPTSKVLYDSDGKEIGLSSHFTHIQIAYQYGLLAGILFLMYNIISGIKSIQFALQGFDRRYSIVPFVITITYGAMSVVEAISSPVIELIILLYFLVQIPLIIVDREGPKT